MAVKTVGEILKTMPVLKTPGAMKPEPERPFRLGTAFKHGKLYEFDKYGVTVIRFWPEPAAWRKTRTRPWRHVRPAIDLNEADDAFWEARINDNDPDDWVKASIIRSKACSQTAMGKIPREVLDLASQFSKRQWHMLSFLARCGPAAADLTRSNPALAWALASNWVFHRPAVSQPMRAARSLVRCKQREILEWLGFPGTESARKTLAKISPAALNILPIFSVRRHLLDPAAAKILRHVPLITATVYRLLDPQLRPYAAPALFEEAARIYAPVPAWAYELRDTLRMSAQLYPGRPLPIFQSAQQVIARHNELIERINDENMLLMEERTLPDPPLPGTEVIIPLTTTAALMVEGKHQCNCVGSYIQQVLAENVYIYRVLAPERATLSIVRRQDKWEMGEIKGYANTEVSKQTLDAVRAWVRTPPNPVHDSPGQHFLDFEVDTECVLDAEVSD
jgi:hypothetical protein